MKKKFLKISAVILAVMVAGMLLILSACSNSDDEFPTWDISSNGNKITASFLDNGKYGYILTIEGSGKMPDYSSAKDAPWYGKSGRVTEIVIPEGITYIGDNSFPNCAAKSIVVPQSVTQIGENVFPEGAKVYAYVQIIPSAFLYSQTQPTIEGNFWHYVDGNIVEWPSAVATHKKILFVGNSYTYYNDMPEKIFMPLAISGGADVEVTSITEGSCRLDMWADSKTSQGARVEGALTKANDYDIIVLQEQSTYPINHYNDSFLPAAKALANRIAQTQTNCSIYMYETWGSPKYGPNHGGIPSMEAKLRTAYEDVAKEIGATVSYVGMAFTYVYETYGLEKLGKSSDMWLYQDDETHPLYIGSYLAACVHTATILGIDPRGCTFNGELDAAAATLMKEIAYNIVFGN